MNHKLFQGGQYVSSYYRNETDTFSHTNQMQRKARTLVC